MQVNSTPGSWRSRFYFHSVDTSLKGQIVVMGRPDPKACFFIAYLTFSSRKKMFGKRCNILIQRGSIRMKYVFLLIMCMVWNGILAGKSADCTVRIKASGTSVVSLQSVPRQRWVVATSRIHWLAFVTFMESAASDLQQQLTFYCPYSKTQFQLSIDGDCVKSAYDFNFL